MEMYKQAARAKLRFHTPKGVLHLEQLWDLSLADLGVAVKSAKKVISSASKDDDLDFLNETSTVNPEHQLTFDILKDVYVTKKSEIEAFKAAADIKAHNEKILARIYAKQEKELDDLPIEDLQALLK